MQTNQEKTTIANDVTKLPSDPNAALRSLIKITQNLAHLAEREHHALSVNDMMSFAIMQDEKSVTAERYAQMAANFRKRLEEFRSADQGLLNKLEGTQNRLGAQSRINNKMIGDMTARARQTTEGTLFSAQEMAQKHHVVFPQDAANADNTAHSSEE